MDPRLVQHYKRELGHLREVGAEFAREFPKIAARLSMDGVEVADPYVERLLEGFALLAARVQLRLDAEYPRFIQHLIEVVYPGLLASIPSTMIVQFTPDLQHPGLARGHTVARNARLESESVRGSGTHCEFRTGHAVTLWPVSITEVRYAGTLAGLPALPAAQRARSALRIRLQAHGGLRFADLPIDALTFHVAAAGDVGARLHELLGAAATASAVLWNTASGPTARWAARASVAPTGFDDDEALLPVTGRAYDALRLLQEYATLPERFRFVTVSGLRERLAAVAASECELVIPFSRADLALEPLVDARSLALYCTPAINLFPKRLDRVPVSDARWEHQVIVDRTRPLDFEVHEITSVTGHGAGSGGQQRFHPLYATHHTEPAGHQAYYSVRREPRLLSASSRAEGPRSSYVGLETWIALVDARNAPYSQELRQLAVQALVSNRDLPVLLPAGGGWRLDGLAPVARIECLAGPTRPRMRLPEGDAGWGLVSQLGVNYLGLAADDPHAAAANLRTVLRLYGTPEDPAFERQLQGLLSVRIEQVVRRLPFPGPLTFGTGLSVSVEVDEPAFEGASPYLLGSVLERWIARHAAVNSFTELSIASAARSEPLRWAPRIGRRPLI